MKFNAYTIYDRKALQYHAPFFTHTDGSAVRSFADLANDLNTQIGRHPSDYVLYRVGQYEDNSAVLIGHEPAHVADALSLLNATGDLWAKMPVQKVSEAAEVALRENMKNGKA